MLLYVVLNATCLFVSILEVSLGFGLFNFFILNFSEKFNISFNLGFLPPQNKEFVIL